MFLLFKKILNSNPAQLGDIIVRANSLFLYNDDVLENRKLGINYSATRIEISSFPNYTFYTPSTLAQVSSVLNVIDMTGGALPGTYCAGNPGVLDVVVPSVNYPMLKVNMLQNQSKLELQSYVFAPEYLVFSETVVYQDLKTKVQDTALLIVLRDSQQRRFITNLEFSDLVAILEPVVVPI